MSIIKTFAEKIKGNCGYISIETVVIAGLMLVLGVSIVCKLFDASKEISAQSIDGVVQATWGM